MNKNQIEKNHSKNNNREKTVVKDEDKTGIKNILLKLGKVIFVFFIVILLVTIIGTSFWLFTCPKIEGKKNFNRGDNAAWVRHQWFSEKKTDKEIKALKEKLEKMQIKTIYVHVGPVDREGKIPKYELKNWMSNYIRIKKSCPGIKIFAWIGGINEVSYGKAPDTLDLTNENLLNAISSRAAEMVIGCRFDGIHYDIEPLPNNDQGFLKLLLFTRLKVNKTPISVAAPHILPSDDIAGLINRRLTKKIALWSPSYYHAVARQCDEIVVMSYDSGAITSDSYKKFMRYQVKSIQNALSGRDCRFLVGIPTYEERTLFHNPKIETLSNAIKGTILGLESSQDCDNFKGLAIYALWTTDSKEIQEYEKLWIGD